MEVSQLWRGGSQPRHLDWDGFELVRWPLHSSTPTPTPTVDTPAPATVTPTLTPGTATPIPTPTLATATPVILANATIGEPATALLQQAAYLYDGDGNMVKGVINGVVTYYPGRHYNKAVDGATVTAQKNYAFGAQTVAMRTNGTLNWVLGDHLGSASVTANADGSFKSQVQYTAFGEIRASAGITETEYRYTGQLRQAEVGLYYYVARFYDPQLAHFTSADTIVPGAGSAKAFNRYAYTLYNPIRYTDPSGHRPCGDTELYECDGSLNTTTVIFAGTFGTPDSPGPGEPDYGMAIWVHDTEHAVNPIQYPGSIPGVITAKYLQSKNARDTASNTAEILVCYSGGTESCLMYAVWRIQNRLRVHKVVLLGPTFDATNENGIRLETLGDIDNDKNFDDWADYIHYIKARGADVLIVDDGVNSAYEANPSDTRNTCKGCDGSLYTYVNTGLPHGVHWAGSTDETTPTSVRLKDAVYGWVRTGQWVWK